MTALLPFEAMSVNVFPNFLEIVCIVDDVVVKGALKYAIAADVIL